MDLIKDFKKGIMFSAMGKYSNLIIQFIVTAVLSRILTPADYGIVAVVNVFLIFFQMLADFGIGPAIIQNRELDDIDIQHIFTFSTYLSLVLGFAFIFLGKPVSIFYDNNVYVNIFVILGVCVILSSILVVPQNVLLKNKNFLMVNGVTIVANIASGIVSIIFALLGGKYYSLIIGNIVRALVMFSIFFLQSKLRFKYIFDINSLKKIYNFSKNQFAFNFMNYFTRNLDTILIGRFMSAADLGYYNKSYQLSLYPNQVLTSVITPVLLPIMSEYQNDKNILKSLYKKIIGVLGTIGIPLSVFLFFSAEEIILFLFGSQWLGSVPIFCIITFSVWTQILNSCSGAIFQVANRTDLLLISGALSSMGTVLSIILGILTGNILYVAVFVVISFYFSFLINAWYILKKALEASLNELFSELIKPFLMGIIQIFVFILVPDLPFSNLIELIIKGIIFVVVFLGSLFLTGQYNIIKEVLFNKKVNIS